MIPDCHLSRDQWPWSLFQKSIDLLAWWRFHLDAAVTLTVITLRVWSSWLSTCRCIGRCVSVLCVTSVCVWANCGPFIWVVLVAQLVLIFVWKRARSQIWEQVEARKSFVVYSHSISCGSNSGLLTTLWLMLMSQKKQNALYQYIVKYQVSLGHWYCC